MPDRSQFLLNGFLNNSCEESTYCLSSSLYLLFSVVVEKYLNLKQSSHLAQAIEFSHRRTVQCSLHQQHHFVYTYFILVCVHNWQKTNAWILLSRSAKMKRQTHKIDTKAVCRLYAEIINQSSVSWCMTTEFRAQLIVSIPLIHLNTALESIEMQ